MLFTDEDKENIEFAGNRMSGTETTRTNNRYTC